MMALLTALLVAAPTPLEAPPTSLPKASRYVLANGLRVTLIPNRSVPWLEVRLGFRIGSASDPDGKGGLASMVGTMLTAGVPGQDEQAFAEDLARIGGHIEATVDAKSFTVAGQVTTLDRDGTDRFMTLFRAAALEATLPDAVLQRQKKLRIAGIDNLQTDPSSLADVAIRAFVLAGHAEGRPSFGTIASTQALTRADLVAWRDQALVPDHAVLVVGGAFDEATMLAWLDDKFGAWTPGVRCVMKRTTFAGTCASLCTDDGCLDNPTAEARYTPPEEQRPQQPVVLIALDDANMTQVQWRYGQVNPVALTSPSWAAFRLATQVLGGEFTSRLNKLLRTNAGLTYGAYLSPGFGGWESNVMTIETDAPPDALKRSLDIGIGEYDKIAASDIAQGELDDMRKTLVNGFPFRFETVTDVVGQYLFVELEDVPFSYLGDYTKKLATPDAKAVREAYAAAAQRPRTLVVVGPTSLRPALEALNRGPVLVVPARRFLTTGK